MTAKAQFSRRASSDSSSTPPHTQFLHPTPHFHSFQQPPERTQSSAHPSSHHPQRQHRACCLWLHSLHFLTTSFEPSPDSTELPRSTTSSQCLTKSTTLQPAAPPTLPLRVTTPTPTASLGLPLRRWTLTACEPTVKSSSQTHLVARTAAGKSLTPCHLHLASLTDLLSSVDVDGNVTVTTNTDANGIINGMTESPSAARSGLLWHQQDT